MELIIIAINNNQNIIQQLLKTQFIENNKIKEKELKNKFKNSYLIKIDYNVIRKLILKKEYIGL